jgi:hypothetical protein
MALRSCLLVFLLAVANATLAQKYIQVNVTDSVILKPTSVTYRIAVGNFPLERRAFYGEDNTRPSAEYLEERAKDLRKVLLKRNVVFREDARDQYTVGQGDANIAYLIDVKRIEDLEELVKELKSLKNIYGKISEVQYQEESQRDAALFRKILVNAKKQAELLATSAGVKLGTILEIDETSPNSFYSASPLDGLYDEEFLMRRAVALSKAYTRTFSIKFQIID